ncbi:MAG TPA: ribose-phosphate pyrophosphokinase [Dehalococcoidia bacterium]
MYQELSIFTGNAHPALAQAICDRLGRPLGQCAVFEFSNENIFVQIEENVRNRDVFIIQPAASPVSTRLMELFIMLDAFRRASAGRISVVMPYYAYGRSDKKDQPRVPITARLIANILETAGADRLLTVDLHAGQIQGFFNVPVDELSTLHSFEMYFRELDLPDPVVVATDLGASKRARNLAERLEVPLAVMEKRRAANDDTAEIMTVIGEVNGKTALIVDDEVDTAGTLIQAVCALHERGAKAIYAAATHGVLSGPAIKRIEDSPLQQLVVSDSLPTPSGKQSDKIRTLSLAPMLADAITRIHTGQSVGAMFH